jgi:two-component system sensor kinase FixL
VPFSIHWADLTRGISAARCGIRVSVRPQAPPARLTYGVDVATYGYLWLYFTTQTGTLNITIHIERQSEMKSNGLESEVILYQLMAIARVSALAEMASGVAHELNQPLGAIAIFSQAGERMLNRPEPLVNRAIAVFREINQAALGAGEGIQRIRRLFEPDSCARSRCQMVEIISEMRPVLEVLIRQNHDAFQVDAESTLPDLIVDRLRIQQVLYALVQNAADANAADANAQLSSTPMIRIDVSADRYNVETGISDSGPGVAAEVADALFRPFVTTKPRGTGLGLASSRAIIESHEGTIGYESLPQGGSRFWFRLPVAQS